MLRFDKFLDSSLSLVIRQGSKVQIREIQVERDETGFSGEFRLRELKLIDRCSCKDCCVAIDS